MMQIIKYPERSGWQEILKRPAHDLAKLYGVVEQIIKDVRLDGDKAVLRYTLDFDRVVLDSLEVTDNDRSTASAEVNEALKKAIDTARLNIERFHSDRKEPRGVILTSTGIRCWERTTPVERVGLYVPGGTAPLISTVLMLGIPAVLAGCADIILCTPPGKNGIIHPAVLYAADKIGVSRIYRAGGAQAIAAMAYGTESIPAVYKIFGPGNQYVTAAKQLVARDAVAVDLPAGPSEVAIVADDGADPAFVAADLLSQAEHGQDSQVLLVTRSEKLAGRVLTELQMKLVGLQRGDIAARVLENSKIIILKTDEQILEMVNEYAPEHLIINTDNYRKMGDRIRNAGSVFLGAYAPVSAGDYASGTNHTLPTNGAARAYSGVSIDSFRKTISFQEISKEGLAGIRDAVVNLAEAEGLTAHADAVSLRLDNGKKE